MWWNLCAWGLWGVRKDALRGMLGVPKVEVRKECFRLG